MSEFNPWLALERIRSEARPVTTYETITPATAADMLTHNVSNRRVRRNAVIVMANAMASGQWQTTHQGIAFDRDGRLIDGQHRLAAVVRANVPVVMAVSRNLSPDTFKVLDGAAGSAGLRNLRDVTNADRRVLEPCSMMARLSMVGAGRKVTYDTIYPLLNGPLGNACIEIIGAYGRNVPIRTSAAIRLAAAVRLLSDPSGYVLEQYRALATLQYDEMSPFMQGFCRIITTHGSIGGDRGQITTASTAWHAFDLKKRDRKYFSAQEKEDGCRDMVRWFKAAYP